MNILLFVLVIFVVTEKMTNGQETNRRNAVDANFEAAEALQTMEDNLTIYATSAVQKSWFFYLDATNVNADIMNSAKTEFGVMYYHWWKNFLLEYDYVNVTDPQLIRQFQIQSVIGTSILIEIQLSKLNNITAKMMQSYSSKVCKFEDSCDGESDEVYSFPNVQQILRTSDDYMELGFYWAEWREKSGIEVISNYEDYIILMNIAAQGNGFSHAGEMWLHPYIGDNYSVDDFWAKVDNLFWKQIFPLYKKLHGYVRWYLKSKDIFMNGINDENNLLPVNILGSISAEDWQSLYRVIQPYPSEHLINITSDLLHLVTNLGSLNLLIKKSFPYLNKIMEIGLYGSKGSRN